MVGRRKEEKNIHDSPALPSAMAPATKRKAPNQVTNGENSQHNNIPQNGMQMNQVVSRDMVYYCFDVLLSHLKRMDLPRSKQPKFTNDA